MKDMGVIGAGNLMAANAGIGQQVQKQLGQPVSPSSTWPMLCHRRHRTRVACMAVKAGEADMGLAFGVESCRAPDCCRAAAAGRTRGLQPFGPLRGGGAVDGRIGTEIMPGVFAQIRVRPELRGDQFRALQDQRQNHSHSTLNPLAAYKKKMTLEEIMGDVMTPTRIPVRCAPPTVTGRPRPSWSAVRSSRCSPSSSRDGR